MDQVADHHKGLVAYISQRAIQKTIAIIALALFVFAGIVAVRANLLASDSVRLTPRTTIVTSSPNLPGEVKLLEARNAAKLFDRDTISEFTAFGNTTFVDAVIDNVREIRAIKLYGAAPYMLTAQVRQNGGWVDIPAWSNIDLSRLSAAWHSFTLPTGMRGDAVRFRLTVLTTLNAAGANSTGVREIEIWGSGTRAIYATGENASDAVARSESSMPEHLMRIDAGPVQHIIGSTARDFNFDIGIAPARIKKAWLVYESYGVSHWVSSSRAINGRPFAGGEFMFTGKSWLVQHERVHPRWFNEGANTLTFRVPEHIKGSYSVRNVRLLLEFDHGANFIAHTSGAPETATNHIADVHDGKIATGWRPYEGAIGATAGKPTLMLDFDRPTEAAGLSFYLVDVLQGSVTVEYRISGKWQSAGIAAINANKLNQGWNQVRAPSAGAADGLRLIFGNGAGSNAEIREVYVIGSGVGPADGPHITVSYPDSGQFYGRTAYICGFLHLLDNGSGKAALFIAGKELAHIDGAFGALVSKDEVGLEGQADDAPWQVDIEAVYPDGQRILRTVALNKPGRRSVASGVLPSLAAQIAAHKRQRMNHDEAELDITEGALDANTVIRITSLNADELPPLDPGMTNVTRGPRKGYRFTPHPYKFKKAIKVTLPYDKSLIPPGLSEKDVKTFYYDEELGRWVPLDKFRLNAGAQRLTSLTDHFTDMINATVTVPEHPQAVNFNPTQIKDIKAADPGAGIGLIAPPQANNTGTANLSYPIELPAGRNGMQPRLAIQYSSGGGNGWLGLGWNLSVPEITVDTRWGVPRYSVTHETETYSFMGQQMTPLAHRGTPVARSTSSPKIFRMRIEGGFQKIERHGTGPSDYFWVVTDKSGTRHYYGSTNGTSKDVGSTLGSAKGVFRWLLTKSIDTNGNTVVYQYAKICDIGTDTGNTDTADPASCTGGVDGYQIYLSRIEYTGNEAAGSAAPYRVDFIRDSARTGYMRIRDQNAGYDPTIDRRPDVSIDARGGFKQVTSERLTRIDIRFNNQPVRSYALKYKMGVFSKSLLDHVAQIGADGAEFNRHAFTYYDEVVDKSLSAPIYRLFEGAANVTARNDDLKEHLLGVVTYPQTLVGGSYGSNSGHSGFFGIGQVGNGLRVHGGVTFGSNSASSRTKLTLVDIDGDGRADKVYVKNGLVYYRRNLSNSNTGEMIFDSTAHRINGLTRLSSTRSNTSSQGVKFKAGSATAYRSNSTTTTTDSVYFTDVNGDGFIDQIDGGLVRFGYRDPETGLPAFTLDSSKTAIPIAGGAISTEALLADMAAERTRIESENPLMDSVRRWVAPYDGVIRITGKVRLHNYRADDSLSDEARIERARYETADGVRLTIQHNGGELWVTDIGAEDYGEKTPEGVSRITVKKNDTIYFRVHSKYDGSYDRVYWAPRIQYVDANGSPLSYQDANQRNVYDFSATSDFILAGRRGRIILPYHGNLKLDGVLEKTRATTDDVRLSVQLYESVKQADGSYKHILVPNTSITLTIAADKVGELKLDHMIVVKKDQALRIVIESDSPIDMHALKWGGLGYPRIYYTAAYMPAGTAAIPADSGENALPESSDDIKPNTDAMTTPENGVLSRQEIKAFADNDPNRERPLLVVPARYNADIYSANTEGATPRKAWVAPRDGVLLMTPWVTLKRHHKPGCYNDDRRAYVGNCLEVRAPDGDIYFTAKRRGALIAKQRIQIRNKSIVPGTHGYDALMLLPVKQGEEIFFDFSTRDPELAQEISSKKLYFDYGSGTAWTAPLSEVVSMTTTLNASIPGDSDNVASGTVMMIVRNAAGEIKYRNAITVGQNATLLQPFDLDAKAGEQYYFDFFTVDTAIHVTGKQVWAAYSGDPAWQATRGGKISVRPTVAFSDQANGTFTLRISKNSQAWVSHNYVVNAGVVTNAGEGMALDVNSNDSIRFEYIFTNHQLSSFITAKGGVAIDEVNDIGWTVPASWANASGKVNLEIAPVIEAANGASGELRLRIWRGNVMLGEKVLQVTGGATNGGASAFNLTVNPGDALRFEYTSTDAQLAQSIGVHAVQLSTGNQSASLDVVFNITNFAQPIHAVRILMPDRYSLHQQQTAVFNYPMDHPLYGDPYRQWSYVGYEANEDRGTKPIIEPRLRLRDQNDYKRPNAKDTAYMAIPSPGSLRWVSADEHWWVSDLAMSSSRRGLDYIDIPDAAKFEAMKTAGVVRLPRRSRGSQSSRGGGFIITANYSSGASTGELDLLDMNGDRFPDQIGGGSIQYTDTTGGLGSAVSLAATNTTSNSGTSYSTDDSPKESPASAIARTPSSGNTKPDEPRKRVTFSVSASFGRSDGVVQISDINGDGLPDRLRHDGGRLMVQLNLGYGYAPEEYWGAAQLNHSRNSGLTIGAGLPAGGSPQHPTENVFGFSANIGGSLSHNSNGGKVQLADANGDGLADYIFVGTDGKVYVAFNTGAGFTSAIETAGYLPILPEIPGHTIDATSRTAGTLLNDGASLSATASVDFMFAIPIGFFGIGIDIVFGGGVNIGETMTQPTIALRDVDGDGLVDSMRSTSDAGGEVARNKTGRTNLLHTVTRPLGARFTLSYERKGNTYDLPQSRWVMSEVMVFDGITDDTPARDRALGSDYQLMRFKYAGGKYDRYERDFLGFASVTTVQHNTSGKNAASVATAPAFRQTVQLFLNDHIYNKGLLRQTRMESLVDDRTGNALPTPRVHTKKTNTYFLRDLDTGAELVTGDLADPAARVQHLSSPTVFPALVRTDSQRYEYAGGASALKSTYTLHTYDEYGNARTFFDAGDAEYDGDEVWARIGYAHESDSSCKTSHITGAATSIVVSSSEGDTGNWLRMRTAKLDCATGNLVWVRQHIDGSTYAQTDLTYDTFGSLETVTGPPNDNPGGERHKLKFSYDGPTHSYMLAINDLSFGYGSKATYDYRFGKPLTTTDVNGNVVSYAYDTFGRTTQITGPYEQAAGRATISFAYHPYVDLGMPATASWAHTAHYDRDAAGAPKADTIDTILFADGLKRILQTKKDASVGGAAVMIASGRVTHDGLGRVVRQYYPTMETGGYSQFKPGAVDAVQPTATSYDALDRVVATTLPDNSTTRIAYAIAAPPVPSITRSYFMTTVTDANGKVKATYKDIRELIAYVREHNPGVAGQETLVTGYVYDPLKQITLVTDAMGNRTTVEYDRLGRRIAIDNPDTGRTEYRYDAASNLTAKITATLQAQGKAITYQYDHSRLIGIDYPNFPENNVRYTYGDSGAKGINGVGRVIRVRHGGGAESRVFGKLGETIKETKTLISGAAFRIYTTEYDFDTFGRLMTLKLPDGEVVTHGYDAGGNVHSISGTKRGETTHYLKSLTYDKFEQRRTMQLGNGITTHYAYDPATRRLCALVTGKAATAPDGCLVVADTQAGQSVPATSGAFQAIAYQYDRVGNITALQNQVAVPRPNQYGGPATQTFQYDGLYRLTGATGHIQTGSRVAQTYTLGMQYDAIHNITRKTQVHQVLRGDKTRRLRGTSYDWAYAYNPSGPSSTRPHAPIHIGERAFTYDANGNQTGFTHDTRGTRRNIDWDEENRIRAIHDPGNTLAFRYDDQGQRTQKKGQRGETTYVSQFYTVKNGAITSKHIYAGKSRIVTRLITAEHAQTSRTLDGETTASFGTLATDGTTITAANDPGTADPALDATATDATTTDATATRGNGYLRTRDGFTGGNPGKGHSKGNGNGQAQAKNPTLSGNHPGRGQERCREVSGQHGQGRGCAGNQASTHNPHLIGGDTNNGGANTGGGTKKATSGKGADFLYYYHPDHLGSSSYVTDAKGEIYEHIAYFPFGETWLEQATSRNRIAYKYTAKEIDTETGLYYYGARYYDPRTSVWVSVDPILGEYLPTGDKKKDQNLPGMGGAHNTKNISMYSYAHQNPMLIIDPDGKASITKNIDDWAEGCGPAKCAAAALTKALYYVTTLGFAPIHDQMRDAYDRGEMTGTQYIKIGIGGGGAVALTSWFTGKWGGEALSAVLLSRAANKATPAMQQLVGTMAQLLRRKAGFSDRGLPIILDVNLQGRGLVHVLRKAGFNVRSVQEIFGRSDVPDSVIRRLAEQVGGRVLTRDRGRDIGGGFGRRAIQVNPKVVTEGGIVRTLKEALRGR